MKATISKGTLIYIALMAISSIGFTQIPLTKDANQSPIEFKFIGKVENQPLFSLKVNDGEKGGYLINVRDENNEVLFSEETKGENLSRKYKLDISEENIDYSRFRVTFEITSRKTHKTTIYNVTKNIHVVEDILIAKL